MRISRRAQSGSESKPSTISYGAIARKSSASGKLRRRLKPSSQRWSLNCGANISKLKFHSSSRKRREWQRIRDSNGFPLQKVGDKRDRNFPYGTRITPIVQFRTNGP